MHLRLERILNQRKGKGKSKGNSVQTLESLGQEAFFLASFGSGSLLLPLRPTNALSLGKEFASALACNDRFYVAIISLTVLILSSDLV